MTTAFFKLTNQFAVEATKGLSAAEIRILLFIKTMNPFGDRKLVLSTDSIAEKLEINRSTVSRALKKLTRLGKIAIEIIRQVTISTPVQNDNQDAKTHSPVQNGNKKCVSETADAISHSKIPNCNEQESNPAPEQESVKPQTNHTYSDFIHTLSEAERESFFDFVREKTKNFNPAIVSLTDYLRSQSRYLELYSEFRRVVPEEEANFSIEEWKNKPEWKEIKASIERAGIAFIGIGGIDRKYEHIPQLVRKQLVDYVRANPELL